MAEGAWTMADKGRSKALLAGKGSGISGTGHLGQVVTALVRLRVGGRTAAIVSHVEVGPG